MFQIGLGLYLDFMVRIFINNVLYFYSKILCNEICITISPKFENQIKEIALAPVPT